MTHFLTRLAKRTLGLMPTVKPLIAPMFAPRPLGQPNWQASRLDTTVSKALPANQFGETNPNELPSVPSARSSTQQRNLQQASNREPQTSLLPTPVNLNPGESRFQASPSQGENRPKVPLKNADYQVPSEFSTDLNSVESATDALPESNIRDRSSSSKFSHPESNINRHLFSESASDIQDRSSSIPASESALDIQDRASSIAASESAPRDRSSSIAASRPAIEFGANSAKSVKTDDSEPANQQRSEHGVQSSRASLGSRSASQASNSVASNDQRNQEEFINFETDSLSRDGGNSLIAPSPEILSSLSSLYFRANSTQLAEVKPRLEGTSEQKTASVNAPSLDRRSPEPISEPPVQITIGRVIVRGITPPVNAQPSPTRQPPQLSLETYLNQRSGGTP